MSEYWKSTPKYWCKHCKTFVRDTKLEKTNHEATPKHQGNLKRFLRDLHRGHERDERDTQRAKDEVARLNGVVSDTPAAAAASEGAPWRRKPVIPANNRSSQATPADRKQQLQQLAELGVAVPEEFRREMAMAGDWQTLSQRAVFDTLKQEDDSKTDGLNVGVRKRKYEGQEEQEEAGETVARNGWGSTTRTYPGPSNGEGDNLDSLLQATKSMSQKGCHVGKQLLEKESLLQDPEESAQSETPNGGEPSEPPLAILAIKRENSDSMGVAATPILDLAAVDCTPIKSEEDAAGTGIVFKKRKAKQIRQK